MVTAICKLTHVYHVSIMIMRIHMMELVGGAVLAGAVSGRKALAKLIELTDQEPLVPEPVFLDFAGVDVATASFLRETVLAYRDTVRRRRSNFYPVIANAYLFVFGNLLIHFIDSHPPPYDGGTLLVLFFPLVLLLIAFTYGIVKIPSLVNSLFTGRSGESAVPRF